MSVVKGIGTVVVLIWTTDKQLEYIKSVLDNLSKEAWAKANEIDTLEAQSDMKVHALQNICCDLEIPGYEMD